MALGLRYLFICGKLWFCVFRTFVVGKAALAPRRGCFSVGFRVALQTYGLVLKSKADHSLLQVG